MIEGRSNIFCGGRVELCISSEKLERNSDQRALMRSIIRLGPALHLKVIAEGIETAGQLLQRGNGLRLRQGDIDSMRDIPHQPGLRHVTGRVDSPQHTPYNSYMLLKRPCCCCCSSQACPAGSSARAQMHLRK